MGKAEVKIVRESMTISAVTLSHEENGYNIRSGQTLYRTVPENLKVNDQAVHIEHSISPEGPVDLNVGSQSFEIFPGSNETFTDGITTIAIVHHKNNPTHIT